MKSRIFSIGIALLMTVCVVQPSQAAKKKAFNGKVCTLVGTAKNDVLKGTSKSDVICGLGGNDTIKGLGGNDTIDGGSGSDKLYGSSGRDAINGGSGNDTLSGGTSNDSLYGAGGNDLMLGDSGIDSFYPGSGLNTCELNEEASRPEECQLLRDFSGLLHRVQIGFTGTEYRNCWITMYYADSVPPEWHGLTTIGSPDGGFPPAAVGFIDNSGKAIFDIPSGNYKGFVGLNDYIISRIRTTENSNFNTSTGCQPLALKKGANEKQLQFSKNVTDDLNLGSVTTPQLVQKSIVVKTSSGTLVPNATIEVNPGYFGSTGVSIYRFGTAYNFVGTGVSMKTNSSGVWSTDAYAGQQFSVRATKVISGITFRTTWRQFSGASSESAELTFQ